MGLVSLTTITNGTLADATVVMANYNAIAAQVNGHLDNANLDPALLALVGVSDPAHVRSGSAIIPGADVSAGAFALMAHPDIVGGIVVPANGFLEVQYQATWQESIQGNARAAIFVNNIQLKAVGTTGGISPIQQAALMSNPAAALDTVLTSFPLGLASYSINGGYTGDTTAGQSFGIGPNATYTIGATQTVSSIGGPCRIFLPAGTYDVAVMFQGGGGSVTAKNRRLYVRALGY